MNTREALSNELQRGGFYPELVDRILSLALAGEDVVAYLVHPETSFDTEIYRHLTAMVLTPSRLISVHVDDDPVQQTPPRALATTEAVPLGRIRSVALTHVVTNPAQSKRTEIEELTITIGWGAANRLDLEPAACADPNCDADHGYTGLVSGDDLGVRVSAHADGAERLNQAIAFADALSQATSGAK